MIGSGKADRFRVVLFFNVNGCPRLEVEAHGRDATGADAWTPCAYLRTEVLEAAALSMAESIMGEFDSDEVALLRMLRS